MVAVMRGAGGRGGCSGCRGRGREIAISIGLLLLLLLLLLVPIDKSVSHHNTTRMNDIRRSRYRVVRRGVVVAVHSCAVRWRMCNQRFVDSRVHWRRKQQQIVASLPKPKARTRERARRELGEYGRNVKIPTAQVATYLLKIMKNTILKALVLEFGLDALDHIVEDVAVQAHYEIIHDGKT
jgi:hypothetical protein